MATLSPTIHILDKANYSKHRLVTRKNEPPTPLAPSSIRLRPRMLGLTTNNLTYARLGHLMGWYDVYPLPRNIPEPYNDGEAFGRIAAWGYAEITESTVPEISSGQTVFGYLPVSTGVEDVCVSFAEHEGEQIQDHIIIKNKHRQHLLKIYNRYQVCASLSELEKVKSVDSLGWDALMQVLFGTSYNLNMYGFAWEEGNRIHPSAQGEWSTADADLRGATIVILNASGKTGMSFAYSLRHHRPKEHQPKTIIGVASPASVSQILQSGLYNKAVLNSDFESTSADIDQSDARRTLLFDFGARKDANVLWKSCLCSNSVPFTLITVGGEVMIQDPEAIASRSANIGALNIVNASLLREKGIEVGGEKYFEEFSTAFDEFKGKVKGLRLQWGEGMEEWEQGWEAFCRDEVRADTGLVYRL
ncbi:hypothetical protein P153DRAFT_367054 [Dothidotthia symphoricarpi CBS 119687]|uniref:Uncharacterized protein n=1 Tax=Dothidotthia symphoricarpi CBS 119687 TaxID=1392245 RepID=A0A6A6AFH2_9PLEO|nr:uncharacterized protein P153DRAFT_367054 [Dothidotthia symphoricarpi CBS 119687]KAF2129687.1 hypothetical protein P153DRAFT_367054 [Dothidotthia symphoricarpi CBS 119687]